MKKLLPLSVAALLVSISFVAFNVQAEVAKAPQASEFSDSNKAIMLNPAKTTFSLKLKSNPTTGYSWFLVDYNPAIIKPISHKFYRGSDKLLGAPGFELWKFAIRKKAFAVPQYTEIKLRYMRPWVVSDGQALVFKIVASDAFVSTMQAPVKKKDKRN